MDEEFIPEAVPPAAGGRQAGHFFPGEVGDDTQGLGDQGLGDERAASHNWTKLILVQSYRRLRGKVKGKNSPGEGGKADNLDKSASFV